MDIKNKFMFNKQHLQKFNGLKTPFYYYDTVLLKQTLKSMLDAAPKAYHIHYALKANSNPKLLSIIKNHSIGADCVSGNEVKRALEIGFTHKQIAFAGVGKSDEEILIGLENDIFSFNVESIPELMVINELASKQNKVAHVALRINPNVDAYTHKYITTGLEENKFGINPYEFDTVIEYLNNCKHIKLVGLHFHIGSQIQSLTPFKNLCLRVNEINKWFLSKGLEIEHINVGGGLGINYQEPDKDAIVDFKAYFNVFEQFLELRPKQQVHFELGRCIIAQCGSLISKVLYIKNGINTNFAILDAGMTELIRPALYQAYHKIENITATAENRELNKYDVVGPICESSDCFGKAVVLPETKRGDLVAIRSAGAYGEVMSSNYNLRETVSCIFDED